MNREEYHSYTSEIQELESLLREIPTDRIIERHSLERRLKTAKDAICGIKETDLPFTINLTFRGKPVIDSHGIAANFGTTAANAFSEAISAIAAGISIDLQDKGPIPDKQKNDMLIIGTAIGSFGFKFELPKEIINATLLGNQETPVEKAISIFQDLLDKTTTGSDDDIAEIIDEIPSRAIKKTADFLNIVAQSDALCAIDFRGKQFQFDSLDKIKTSSKRLQENNIQEDEEILIGNFLGVLPFSRTFEFQTEAGVLIKGKIGRDVENPDRLNLEFLHKRVKVVMNLKKFGKGKPRYTVLSLNQINII